MKKTTPVADATVAQLRAYGNATLGLTISQSANRAQVLAKLAEVGFDKDAIEIDEAAPALQKPAAPAVKLSPAETAAALEAERAIRDAQVYTIMIDIVDEPGGNRPVPVGPNGVMMLIPRGRAVEVRHPFVEVLNNAKRNVGEQLYDEVSGRPTKVVYHEVAAYPWRIMSGPRPGSAPTSAAV